MTTQVRAVPHHPATFFFFWFVYLRNERRLWLPGGSGDSVAQWQQCVCVRCQETGSHPSLVSSVFPDGRVRGRGRPDERTCPTGWHSLCHTAFALPSEAPAPSTLSWYLSFTGIQSRSAGTPPARPEGACTVYPCRSLMSLTTAKAGGGKFTRTVSVLVKVLRRGHSSVNTCFFERKLLASDISLQKKAVTFFFPHLIRVALVSNRRPGTLVSWLNTAKEGGCSPCRGLQSSGGFCETETIMSAITFYREKPTKWPYAN